MVPNIVKDSSTTPLLASLISHMFQQTYANMVNEVIQQEKLNRCYGCTFHLALVPVAASISHFVTATTKLSCCSSNKNMSLLFFISRSRFLSPFFSLSSGLPNTFFFSLSFSCSIFQICGHDNYSKLNT